MKLKIITGLSGSGKTTALRTYEDMGYYAMDNVPAYLIEKFIELNKMQESPIEKMAVVICNITGFLLLIIRTVKSSTEL